MFVLIMIAVVVGLWLFLGYWSSAAVARYFVEEFGPETWDRGEKIASGFFTCCGLLSFLSAFKTLNRRKSAKCFFNPLWTWPFWTPNGKKGDNRG